MIRPLWVATGWFLIAGIVYLSLATLAIETNVPQGDKLGHLLAYGTLMVWWSQLYAPNSTRRWLAMGFILLGAAIELAQSLTPNRHPELLDLFANAAGVLLGWLASPPRIPNLYTRLAATFPGIPR